MITFSKHKTSTFIVLALVAFNGSQLDAMLSRLAAHSAVTRTVPGRRPLVVRQQLPVRIQVNPIQRVYSGVPENKTGNKIENQKPKRNYWWLIAAAVAGGAAVGYSQKNTIEDLIISTNPERLDQALLDAVDSNDVSRAKLLINLGADINAKNALFSSYRSPLKEASSCGNVEMVKLLIDAGAVVENGSNDAMWLAVRYNHTEVVRLLVEAGARVNAREHYLFDNDNRNTVLHLAIQNKNLEVVRLLVEAGADIFIKNNLGNTPLDWAESCSEPEITELLLNSKQMQNVTNASIGAFANE